MKKDFVNDSDVRSCMPTSCLGRLCRQSGQRRRLGALILALYTVVITPEVTVGETYKDLEKIQVSTILLTGDVYHEEYGIDSVFVDALLKQFDLSAPKNTRELEQIGIELTKAYREKGLAFTRVELFPQKVVDGILFFEVSRAVLGDVIAYDNDVYKTEYLVEPFDNARYQTLYDPDIMQTLNAINNYPGLDVYGFYSRGSKPGEVRLNLKVLNEQKYQSTLIADNHGLTSTGEYRLTYAFLMNNFFHPSSTLSTAFSASEESGNLLGHIKYAQKVGRDNASSYQLGVTQTEIDIGGEFESFGLTGDLTSAEFRFSHNLMPSSETTNGNRSLDWGVSYKSSTIISEFTPLSLLNDETIYTKYFISYNQGFVNRRKGWRRSMGATLAYGSLTEKSIANVDDAFHVFNAHFRFAKAHAFYWLGSSTIDANLQVSGSILPGAELVPLTGPYGVNGYERGILSGHQALIMSYTLNSRPWQWGRSFGVDGSISVGPFVDIAVGVDNAFKEINDDSDAFGAFSSGGLQLTASAFRSLIIKGQLGFPLGVSGDLAERFEEEDSTLFYFSMSYSI